tara:strand:+ start:21 stop:551 length:531 start_codon:yes stop_codon:yes gene_type:complete
MSEPTTEDLLIRPRLGEGEKTATDMTIIARAEALGGDFTIMQGRIGPKRLLPPHTHTYEDQAVYLIEGTLEFEVGGEGGLRFRAEKGDWVLKPRGIQHTFWNPSEDVTVQYIELSGKDGFEKFVDGRAKGVVPWQLEATFKLGLKTAYPRIPVLLKRHGLVGIASATYGDGEEEAG